MIRGFIFDLDGVLTDTAEFHYRAWKQLADEEGLPFDRERNEALRGVSRRESLEIIMQNSHRSEEQIQEMMDRKNRYYLEMITEIGPQHLLPGVYNLLAELRQAGIKIALGSASKNAVEVISRLGIAGLFDAMSDGHSVTHQKPSPDLFIHAADQLGLKPGECVVVEDAEAGILAARAGGFWCIGLGPQSRIGAADLVLDSLANAHLADLLAVFP